MSTALKAWQKLGLPKKMSSGNKAATVRRALLGIKPTEMSPQVWAWCELNPNGIRRNKKKKKKK